MRADNHHGADCRELVAAISSYVGGELTPARCRELEAHLAACPCCDHFADSLRRAIAVCRAAGRTRLPSAVQRRAKARIAALLGSTPVAAEQACAADSGRRRTVRRPKAR